MLEREQIRDMYKRVVKKDNKKYEKEFYKNSTDLTSEYMKIREHISHQLSNTADDYDQEYKASITLSELRSTNLKHLTATRLNNQTYIDDRNCKCSLAYPCCRIEKHVQFKDLQDRTNTDRGEKPIISDSGTVVQTSYGKI